MLSKNELEGKIEIAKNNIVEWFEYWEGNVFITFSGGKDSTAMLHLARSLYPDIPAVFSNTGLEMPEVVLFVKQQENIEIVRPQMEFHKVVEKYGYPIISKAVAQKVYEIRHSRSNFARNRKLSGEIGLSLPKTYRYLLAAPFKISDKCCNFIKKEPIKRYQKKTGRKPMIGIMAADSRPRLLSWKKFGCNAFGKKSGPESRPIMSWTTEHVWAYIKKYNVPYSKAYDLPGVHSTGCMFCGFGLQMDGRPNRFERMKETHPKQYEYIINKLGMREVLDSIGAPY